MKKIFVILLAAAAAAGCSAGKRFSIEGSGDAFGEMSYVTLKTPPESGYNTIDSVAVKDKSFMFKGSIGEPHMAYLTFVTPDLDEASGIRSVTLPVFLEPGRITVTGENDTIRAIGTPLNDTMTAFDYRLSEMLRESSALIRQGRRSDMEAVRERFMVGVKRSVADNAGNPYGPWLLQYMQRDFRPQELLDAVAMFPAEVQPRFAEACRQAEAKLRTMPGQPYVDIVQKDADGREVTLRSVVETEGNRYVLIDFWASWCGPCMNEVPYLTQTYAAYHNKGFEIYGVSFDNDRNAWLDAVREKDMGWIHVSDLNGWDNQARHDYVVNSIPGNFLVECSTGKIVAYALRGDALQRKIAELLD